MLGGTQHPDHATFVRIVVPALVTFTIFALILFGVMLPFFESRLMDQKRLQVRELVDVVHADLTGHADEVASGTMTVEEAQENALEHIRLLRYGPDGKDYFWINDRHPRMIMHPYRLDLEGEDVSDFADPEGKHLFVEAVEVVSATGAGYIEYQWQWKDDPDRVVPKISYVRLFEPWGWIVGSGIYVQDVREELAGTQRILLALCGLVLLVITLLCVYLVREAHFINERRRQTEQESRDQEETFRALAEGSVDIIIRHDLDFRYVYANPAAAKASGIPVEDIIGSRLGAHSFRPDLLAGWTKALEQVVRSGEVNRIEFNLEDGTWYDWMLVPELDDQGKVRGVLASARDITELKRAERALQEEKAFSETVLGCLPGIFFVYRIDDGDLRLVRYNHSHVTLTGYTDEELFQMTPMDFLEGDDMAVAAQAIQDALSQGEARVRLTMIIKDGRKIPYDLIVQKMEMGDGELYIIGMGLDMSDSVNAQEAMRRSEERYHALFENASDAIFVVEGRDFMMCNAKTLEVFGCTREQIAGQTLAAFSPERQPDGRDSREGAAERIEAALRGEPQFFEWLSCRQDGTVFDTEVSLSRIELAGEDCVLAIVRDVTERKRVQSELNQFASVIEQSSEIVVITDMLGDITYVNPAFEKVSGYSAEEALGQNPRFLKSGEMDESVYRELREAISCGDTWTGRLVNRRKDGALFTEDATISPLRSPSGEVTNLVAAKRDVTRELQLEEQFHQAQKMEAVGQLAGGVAHDFNNLLQVILGYGELALAEREAEGETDEMLTEVLDAANRATTLVRQLLAFSRRQLLKLESVDLSEAVSDMAKMVKRVIGEHIAFNILSEPGLKSVHADKGQVEQVLMNLCVNARDAMGESGTLTVETRSTVLDGEFCEVNTWASPGRYVQLSVTDTGCGMDEATRKRIFEPFFTTKEQGKGTGLGLATVFGIVRQHKGMINVYSEVGVGTTFTVYFPLTDAGQVVEEEIGAAPPPGGTETILLADDDEAVCGVAEAILIRAGYTVLKARDGEEAIQAFDEHAEEIHLALLDVVMPRLGGRAVFDHIKRTSPETGVLFASGYSSEGIHSQFVLEEGMALVQKPYKPAELLRKVRQLLDA